MSRSDPWRIRKKSWKGLSLRENEHFPKTLILAEVNGGTWALILCRLGDLLGQSCPGPALSHRVGRVLSFFSSRRNWDSPNPSPAGECVPPRFWGEVHTRWREKGWESPNSDEGTYTVVLFIYTYFVPYPYQLHKEKWASAWNNNKHKRPYLFCIFLDQPIMTLKRKGRVQMSTREILKGDENLRFVHTVKTLFLNFERLTNIFMHSEINSKKR